MATRNSNAAFKKQFAKLMKKAGARADMVARKSALMLQSSLIAKSPVDTGRFRSNWQCGIAAVNPAADAAPGVQAIAGTLSTLQTWRVGQSIFLTNSLPYAKRLEDGWSKQAPHGMVKLTVQAFRQTVDQVAASVQNS